MRHMTNMVALLLGLLLAASNVMADKAPPREDPKPEPKADELPWDVEAIRNLWADGIAFEFELKVDGVNDGGMILESENITDKGFLATTVSISKEGDERVEKSKDKTWDEYLAELKKRFKGATITDETIKVPSGEYACKRYSIPAAGSSVNYWLCDKVPGMFIKAENRMEKDSTETVQSWELADIDVPMVRMPWSRKQCAESWKDGVKIAYAIEAGPEKGTLTLDVSAADAKGFTASQTEEVNGKKSTKENETTTWAKYLREFSVPRKDAKISEETIETPAGKFECKVVVRVREGETRKTTTTFYFAKNEPGVLVKMVKLEERGEKKETESFTLTELKKGK
ncbi:hypothetical protein PLCT2_02896 [Planctomycetaceae bacterium]|nr:hypothetical protein PLCT2_02896 [Planctomycetaceae bacterium]